MVLYDLLGMFYIEFDVLGFCRYVDLVKFVLEVKRFFSRGVEEFERAVSKIRMMYVLFSGLLIMVFCVDWKVVFMILS